MPFGVRSIETAGGVGFRPTSSATRPNQEDVTLRISTFCAFAVFWRSSRVIQ